MKVDQRFAGYEKLATFQLPKEIRNANNAQKGNFKPMSETISPLTGTIPRLSWKTSLL